MMQTAAVQKISEQNSPYKAMLDRAYMIGYTDAMNQERSRRRAARERRERKKYFAMQKLNGVALLIFTAVAIKILEGDATIAFITVPLGLSMLLSKEMLVINIGDVRKRRKEGCSNEVCYPGIKVRYG